MRIGSSTPSVHTPLSSSSSPNSSTGASGSPSSRTRPEGMPPSASGDGVNQQAMQSFASSFMFNQVQKNIGEQKQKFDELNQPPEDDDDSSIYGE